MYAKYLQILCFSSFLLNLFWDRENLLDIFSKGRNMIRSFLIELVQLYINLADKVVPDRREVKGV